MFLQSRYHNIFLLNQSVIIQFVIVFIASIVLAAGSQIMIPWSPIPFTLQTGIIVLLGLILGSVRAVFAVTLYLFEGAIGLPVFSGFSGGLSVLLGPTAGYLFGFLPAAFVIGWLAEKGMTRSWFYTFLAGLIGVVLIFIVGVLHLQVLLGWKKAYLFGVHPFLMTEFVKLLLVTGISRSFWKKVDLLQPNF